MRKPKEITISPELAAKYSGPGQFRQFDATVKKILAVPRSVILEREAEYKRKAALNPNRRGPKPRISPAVS
jgi:hypothetical protein